MKYFIALFILILFNKSLDANTLQDIENKLVLIQSGNSVFNGAIISEEGLISTCYHGLKDKSNIIVNNKNLRSARATLIQEFPLFDIALLKITTPTNNLDFLTYDLNLSNKKFLYLCYFHSNQQFNKTLIRTYYRFSRFSTELINYSQNESMYLDCHLITSTIPKGASGGVLLSNKGIISIIHGRFKHNNSHLILTSKNNFYIDKYNSYVEDYKGPWYLTKIGQAKHKLQWVINSLHSKQVTEDMQIQHKNLSDYIQNFGLEQARSFVCSKLLYKKILD